MNFVILIIEAANGRPSTVSGQYVKTFDPKGGGGRGFLSTTRTKAEAKRYDSKEAAFSEWKNSSLRAFTAEIIPA
jgi:hypothetical protein